MVGIVVARFGGIKDDFIVSLGGKVPVHVRIVRCQKNRFPAGYFEQPLDLGADDVNTDVRRFDLFITAPDVNADDTIVNLQTRGRAIDVGLDGRA